METTFQWIVLSYKLIVDLKFTILEIKSIIMNLIDYFESVYKLTSIHTTLNFHLHNDWVSFYSKKLYMCYIQDYLRFFFRFTFRVYPKAGNREREKNLIAGSMNRGNKKSTKAAKKFILIFMDMGRVTWRLKFTTVTIFFSCTREHFFPVSFWSQSWLIYVYNLFEIRMDPWMCLRI